MDIMAYRSSASLHTNDHGNVNNISVLGSIYEKRAEEKKHI